MATATQFGVRRHIEEFYEPNRLVTASPGRRLGAYILESLLPAAVAFFFYVTLIASFLAGADEESADAAGGIAAAGMLVFFVGLLGFAGWTIYAWTRGQTPGKQLLSMYVTREDGSRAGGWHMFTREFLVKGILFNGLLGMITFGIVPLLAALWLTWDRNHQALWDKITNTYVAYSPNGFVPSTSKELAPPARLDGGPAIVPGTTEQLRDLARLRDEGIITDEEYAERRQRLVDHL